MFGLLDRFDAVGDGRKKRRIPTPVCVKAVLILFLCRLPSMNALDQYRDKQALRRFLKHPTIPCGDQITNISEVLNLDDLRGVLRHIHGRMGRNKVLTAVRGHRLAVIDGHEINCSYKRCCDECQQRRMKISGEECIQYYHRAVIFQLVGENSRQLLDFELLRPHDDEGTAAMRLIERVLRNYPRSFDILLGDGLYPQARIFKLLRRHNKHIIAVLKDDRRELLKDARGLFDDCPQTSYKLGNMRYQCRDVENLQSWNSFPGQVRVVQSIEKNTVRERIAHKWVARTITSEWIWVTTLPSSEVCTKNIVFFGHERWRIENEGFNELCNHWHANHYFRHNGTSITAFWLILFIAHALFHCLMRNLKPALRADHTMLYWAQQIVGDLVSDRWAFSSA